MSLRLKKRGYKHKTIDTDYNKAKASEQILVQKQARHHYSDQMHSVTQYSSEAN